jgi:peptide/nickel transport system substrate-binding protein
VGIDQVVKTEVGDWAQAGILVRLQAETFNQILGTVFACTKTNCSWEMADWGGVWLYQPDVFPSSDEILTSTASFNVGQFKSATENKLIADSITRQGLGALEKWETYAARELPIIWQPTASPPAEVATTLGGVVENPTGAINPEAWYFTK